MTIPTLHQHIATTPGVLNGRPHIAGRRIAVQHIVVWHERLGMSADEIATNYDLSLGDVYAALSYYFDHRDDIDRDIAASTEFADALRAQTPSKLAAKIRALRETTD
jgi:uncharacterized protein (DUF433 family)